MSDTPETDLWLKQQIVCNYEHEMVSAGLARTLERERNEARTILKVIEQAHHAALYREGELKRERDEIAALVRRLFQLLETVEVSDSEREFHPTYISSCRVAHTMELDKLLPKLKEAAK